MTELERLQLVVEREEDRLDRIRIGLEYYTIYLRQAKKIIEQEARYEADIRARIS